jgi:hypothetical protein
VRPLSFPSTPISGRFAEFLAHIDSKKLLFWNNPDVQAQIIASNLFHKVHMTFCIKQQAFK